MKEDVTGMDETNDPAMLHAPIAIISCVASTTPVLAERDNCKEALWKIYLRQKIEATVTASKTEMKASVIGAVPSSFTISRKPTLTPSTSVENGGRLTGGIPLFISPANRNG